MASVKPLVVGLSTTRQSHVATATESLTYLESKCIRKFFSGKIIAWIVFRRVYRQLDMFSRYGGGSDAGKITDWGRDRECH